jgi:hypothetical protein
MQKEIFMKLSKKFLFGVVICFIFSNLKLANCYEKEVGVLVTTISEKISEAGKKTVAVADFTDLQGNVTELGRFIAEQVSIGLVGSEKKYEVIDRLHLKTLMAEHKLSSTGIIDPKTAKKLGEIAGADAIITGTITPFSDVVKISIKVLAVDTAKIIAASSVDIPRTKAIEELLGKNIEGTSSPSSSTSTSSQTKSIQKVTSGDFSFELKEVKAIGNSLTFILSVVNTSPEDIEVCLRGGRFLDNSGNEYYAIKWTLGSKVYAWEDILGSTDTRSLVSNVPTKITISFGNLPEKITNVSLLEIYFWRGGRGGGDYKVKLRNIPVVYTEK